MIQKIVPVNSAILRKKSKPVNKIDKKIRSLIQDLKDTLLAQTDPEGIGLAAPQIGKNIKVFIMKPDNTITVVINPKILDITKTPKKQKTSNTEKRIMEGCLSLPHYYGPLERPPKIKIKYTTEEGKEIIRKFKGLEAQIIQHEIDHLDGIIFVDRLLEQKLKLYEYKHGEWEEVELI